MSEERYFLDRDTPVVFAADTVTVHVEYAVFAAEVPEITVLAAISTCPRINAF
jgi:hypothetical protein